MPATSPAQERLMQAAAHTPGGYGGVSQKVGREFVGKDASAPYTPFRGDAAGSWSPSVVERLKRLNMWDHRRGEPIDVGYATRLQEREGSHVVGKGTRVADAGNDNGSLMAEVRSDDSKIANLRAERSKLKAQLEQSSPLQQPKTVKQRIDNITAEINKLKARGTRGDSTFDAALSAADAMWERADALASKTSYRVLFEGTGGVGGRTMKVTAGSEAEARKIALAERDRNEELKGKRITDVRADALGRADGQGPYSDPKENERAAKRERAQWEAEERRLAKQREKEYARKF